MINIAICDDSIFDIEHLKSTCQLCDLPDEINIETFHSGMQFLKLYSGKKYDVVFLDIDMPEVSGIEIGKQIRKMDKSAIIIFCTNYPQYAINAYDCEAFHYLLKPCPKDKLEDVLKRAITKMGMIHKYHTVKIQNRVCNIPIADINYIEYCRKHIIYHTNDRNIETTGRFSDVNDELKKYGFYQIHQGYIVNLAKVRDIKGYSIVLDNGENVMISVRKKSDVLLAYAKYTEDFQ